MLRAYVHAAVLSGAAPPVAPPPHVIVENLPHSSLPQPALSESEATRWMDGDGEFGLFLRGLEAGRNS